MSIASRIENAIAWIPVRPVNAPENAIYEGRLFTPQGISESLDDTGFVVPAVETAFVPAVETAFVPAVETAD